jgi:signal transduction histidine kinase
MTIATSAIRSEPHHEIGSIISRHAEELVKRWCVRALAEQPNASRVYLDVLQNELRKFLEAMGRVLLQSGERDPSAHRDQAWEHGEQRWDSGWSLAELVRDYQILQLVVLEHLESELDRPLGVREAMAVGVFINDAIGASIAAYVATRDQHQRELERAGTDALHDAQARKDDFLALVVHELRNPLSPILTATEVLATRLQDAESEVHAALRLIRRQSRQVARILDDLSDITRIARGGLTLRQKVMDVADVLEEAVQATEGLMKEREHRVELTMQNTPLVIKGDPARLVQVLVNLLNNAARYTPPGGQVNIIARRRDDRIDVSVRDTGVGIPEEMLTKVFDMYTRVSGPTESSPDGLGIGLALVKEIVSLHDGTVSVSSDGPGQGAEFVISFPVYMGHEPVMYSTPQPMRLPPSDEAQTGKPISPIS